MYLPLSQIQEALMNFLIKTLPVLGSLSNRHRSQGKYCPYYLKIVVDTWIAHNTGWQMVDPMYNDFPSCKDDDFIVRLRLRWDL